MLRGKFWLTSTGRVFDVSSSEHKIFARKHMLNLDPDKTDYPDARTQFSFIPRDHEISSLLVKPGVKREAVCWLRAGKDERLFAMQYWGWVRVARSIFNAYKLDARTLELIRNATEYWRQQEPFLISEVIDFTETSSWKTGVIPIGCLLDRDCLEWTVGKLRKRFLRPEKAGVLT